MEFNMGNSEWAELILKNNVINRLNDGEKFSSINISLGFDPDSDALRKALGRLGLKKDKFQGLYYLEGYEEQEKALQLLNSIDVEETIEGIAEDRYYRGFIDDFYGGATETVEIDKEIFEEYKELAEQFGCDFDEEFMTMVLLEGLEKYKPVNRRREFCIKYMNENFSKEEVEFILQKEKEGYDIESLVWQATDQDLLSLTPDELEKYVRRQ